MSHKINANLLRAKFKEMGLTQEEVAVRVGMSSNSLSRKILGKRDFRLQEVAALCQFLRPVLTDEDAIKIFLPK